MLKRVQNYAQANPLPTWLLGVAILLTFDMGAYSLCRGTKNPGLFMLLVSMALSSPTTALIARMSETRRAENPVSLEQDRQIGLLALFFAFCSVGSLGLTIMEKRLGLNWPAELGAYAIVVFALSTFLALAMGYAARRTSLGQVAVKLTAGWFFSCLLFAIVRVLIRGI